ncbi:hypothetical protein Scep_003546 [Stephania cephalantha]|uniref:Uncharacterized protein n=1 Tax=Stephania cephalantha TaxID=152367 RepID=A0AAP0KQQ2_9MAGN
MLYCGVVLVRELGSSHAPEEGDDSEELSSLPKRARVGLLVKEKKSSPQRTRDSLVR